jgi:hypothetical protein
VNLIIILLLSTEIGGDKAYPDRMQQISRIWNMFGILYNKTDRFLFLLNLLTFMKSKKYNTYSDQVTLMNFIVNNKYMITEEIVVFDNITYTNRIIHIDNIKICVLDFNK